MIGRLVGLLGTADRARAAQLLGRFDLTEAARRPLKTCSGGMCSRLDLALGLVDRPRVLNLDEAAASALTPPASPPPAAGCARG